MVCVVKLTGAPFRVRLVNALPPAVAGSMACRLRAPLPTATVKFKVLLLQDNDPKEELLRPSTQVSICREDTMGTPSDWAVATIESAPGSDTVSLCMLATKAP